jgi:hypothetical protein
VIFPAGLSTASTTNAGFIILDRGSNYSHDGFRIVAITSLDGSGDPASFGSVKSCTAGNGSSTNGSWGHPSTANGNKQLQVYVLRKDPAADTYLRVSTSINQEFGGVFFSFASLGVAANQKIYGYSLIGPDGVANPSSSQLLSTSDATVYPTTTTEAAGGGLDLLTVNSVFVTGSSVILPVQFISIAGGDKDGHALLNWQLDLTDGNKTLALERSEDGSHFYPLYQSAIAHGHQTMTYTDQPGPGIHYYRLKIAETLTAGISFSQTLSVGIDAAAGWRIYPTMAGRGEALHIQGMPDGMYTLCFTNLYGVSLRQPLWVKNHEAGIMLPSCLGPGMHLLTLDNGKGPLKTARVVVR